MAGSRLEDTRASTEPAVLLLGAKVTITLTCTLGWAVLALTHSVASQHGGEQQACFAAGVSLSTLCAHRPGCCHVGRLAVSLPCMTVPSDPGFASSSQLFHTELPWLSLGGHAHSFISDTERNGTESLHTRPVACLSGLSSRSAVTALPRITWLCVVLSCAQVAWL